MGLSGRDLEVVEHLIAAARTREAGLGTMVARDTTGPWGSATIDGSEVAVPVRVAADVHVQAGDRVCLNRYDGKWVVTHGFTRRTFGELLRTWRFVGSYGNTSSTFVDVPENPGGTFPKLYDDTDVVIHTVMTMYAANASGRAETSLWINGVDQVTQLLWVDLNNHTLLNGMVRVTGLPAGDYPVIARYRRDAGTGDLRVDSQHSFQYHVRETKTA